MIPVNLRQEASANTIPPVVQKELQGPSVRNEDGAAQRGYGEL